MHASAVHDVGSGRSFAHDPGVLHVSNVLQYVVLH